MSGSNVSHRAYDEAPKSCTMPIQLYKNNFLPLSSAGFMGNVQNPWNKNEFES